MSCQLLLGGCSSTGFRGGSSWISIKYTRIMTLGTHALAPRQELGAKQANSIHAST